MQDCNRVKQGAPYQSCGSTVLGEVSEGGNSADVERMGQKSALVWGSTSSSGGLLDIP